MNIIYLQELAVEELSNIKGGFFSDPILLPLYLELKLLEKLLS